MAKVTWKGEGDEATTNRFGVEFKKGEAVEVQNEMWLHKLSQNPNFTVSKAGEAEKPADEDSKSKKSWPKV